MQSVFDKARRGEPVTLGFFGGSITRGERATSADRQYADLIARWWGEQFPKSKITIVNAGVSGTNSTYGCLRVQRDLISQHPDFVVVEFGVNDKDDLLHAQAYEGVIRQLLSQPNPPAIVQLFMMHHDGTNAQAMQSEIGNRYKLPMVSFRDAMLPEFKTGRLKQDDFFADTVHPNDRGHSAIAELIDSLLQQTLAGLPPDSQAMPKRFAELPPALFSDLYAHTRILPSADLQPTACTGFQLDPAAHCWKSKLPGSSIEFDVAGQAIDIMYEKLDGGFGTASVTVDGSEPVLCDAWLNGSWGPLCQVDPIAVGHSVTIHHIRVELLEQKNALSTGHEFRLLGFGAAGKR